MPSKCVKSAQPPKYSQPVVANCGGVRKTGRRENNSKETKEVKKAAYDAGQVRKANTDIPART